MPQLPYTAYETTVSGYWECKFPCSFIHFDAPLEELLGSARPLGNSIRSWLRIVDPGSRAHLSEVFRKHMSSKSQVPFVVELCVNPDPCTSFCVLLTGKVIQWQAGRPVLMIGSFLDITAQKQANKELQRVRDFLHKTNQTAQVGGWELEIATAQIIWTKTAREVFEVPDDFIPSQEQISRFAKKGADRIKLGRAFERAIQHGTAFDVEIQIITYKGKERYVRMVGQPELSGPECIRMYGVVQNINDKKLIEETLLQRQEQLQQATLAKIEFLSVMSHEIRTPMNAVIGFTNLLLENPREDQREYLHVLKFSAEHLLTLINDILDFNKIDAGKIEFEQTDFNLLELLENIKDAQQQEANKKELSLELWRNNNIPKYINGDPLRISQVLSNLVANALKFTAKGKVKLMVELLRQTPRTSTLRFEVKDTGIGIPREKLQYIFEKFTQATSETTRKFGGTGLGLAISKRILELLGSTLQVSSVEGEGSSFYFELTCNNAVPSKKQPEVPAVAPVSDIGRCRILIVEDNTINVMVLKKFLQRWDMICEVAVNGRIAVEKVMAEDFDVVLMDIQMPEMDGYEATCAIRALTDPKYRQLPIIALTASAVGDVETKMKLAGMNDCMSKPFKPDVLHDMIIKHLLLVKT